MSSPAGARLSALAAALPATLFPSACTNERLDREWGETVEIVRHEPLRVVDWFPADGMVGVPASIRPYFFFNRPLEPHEAAELTLAIADGTGRVDAAAELDFDGVGVRFTPAEEIPGGSVALMSLEVGEGVRVESEFRTFFGSGLLFNMSVDLRCEAFGGEPAHAALLTALFEPGVYPLWILQADGLDHDTELPVDVEEMRFGPAYVRDDGSYRIYRDFGFSGRFPDVRIEADGSFRAESEGVFLPLDSPEEVIVLYVSDPVLTGRIELGEPRARMRDVRLQGVLELRWLRKLAETSEGYRAAVDVARLDVDANGNGEPDSVTFAVTMEPEEILPSEYDD